ncbi:MAG TPA: hypothetical protein VEA38_21350 [Terriglobales bacterium]|nr:hypothetical protein [Terriglobales bacterium]
MKRAVVLLGALTLLAGCTTHPRSVPVASSPAPVYVVPNTTYTYTPATVVVPGAAFTPSTTYVPSASPAYFHSTLADCQRANGLWYPATGICQLRP